MISTSIYIESGRLKRLKNAVSLLNITENKLFAEHTNIQKVTILRRGVEETEVELKDEELKKSYSSSYKPLNLQRAHKGEKNIFIIMD